MLFSVCESHFYYLDRFSKWNAILDLNVKIFNVYEQSCYLVSLWGLRTEIQSCLSLYPYA